MLLQSSLDDAFPLTPEGFERLFKYNTLGGETVAHVEEKPPHEAEKWLRDDTTINLNSRILLVYEYVEFDVRRKTYFLVHSGYPQWGAEKIS